MKQIVNPLPPATELRGPVNTYRIVQALGQGSFGITYLATMQTRVAGQMGGFQAEVRVVVKEFFMRDVNGRRGRDVTASSQNGTFADYKRKFMNEAANLARLNHPNIVKVLERFEANNTAYYAMEYLDGGSLDDYIPAHRGLPEAEVVRLAAQMGAALDHMHANRMLHLDIKPNNIMRRSSGDIVLIDFGLSKLFDANGEPESSTNIGLGTKGYAAMEQETYQRGDGFPVTLDVYAFGATLFKMLTGETPPNASIIFNEGFPEAQLMQRGVSYRVREAVKRAMAPATRDRYQSAREVVGALGGQILITGNITDTILDHSTFRPRPTPAPAQRPVPKPTPAQRHEPASRPKPSPSPTPADRNNVWKYVGVAIAAVVCLGLAVENTPLKEMLVGEETPAEELIGNPNNVAYDEQTHTITANGVSFKMIRVEGGTFTMGATPEQSGDADADEKPAHQVTLSSYYIGETEVTQALWEAVMGSNPSYFKGANRPVEQVSWDDCRTFISRLNSATGRNFRLPTEAEWEYAARGGKRSQGYRYSGSNTLDNVAWYDDNSGNETHPVKSKSPNELGIYDMSGNVREWCQDRYGSYSSNSQMNPKGASSGSYRVYRGGGWFSGADGTRVSYRDYYSPDCRNSDLGFRLAL